MREAYESPVWEGQVEKECMLDVTKRFVTPELVRALDPASPSISTAIRILERTPFIDTACTWTGVVDVAQFHVDTGVVREVWDCPACGEQHSDERTDER